MAKLTYVCTACGHEHPRWTGQCAGCGEWNTVSDNATAARKPSGNARTGYAGVAGGASKPILLSSVSVEQAPRRKTTLAELDRVLGGGIVPGSSILIGGHPGAGKSTLLLQVACAMGAQNGAGGLTGVMYVTGEESDQQVALRASRLKMDGSHVHILTETAVEVIEKHVLTLKPAVLIVDSIQVMAAPGVESAPGSVSQVRESAAYLTRLAKSTGTAVFLVGHVTKDGSLAGPKVLEHCVDASLLLEGGADSRYRTLRSHKNRFGAVNELGVFAMTGTGLREVPNPSAIFLSRAEKESPGSIVLVIWEGTRPLLVELQALADSAPHGNPRRLAVGVDQNRLAMLLAVLNRHGDMSMGDQDIFINVVGGVRVTETSSDLAVLVAIASSFKNKVIPHNVVVFGEVGLSGELRPVPNGSERIAEAAKHGFKVALVPKANAPRTPPAGMRVIACQTASEAIDAAISITEHYAQEGVA